MTHVKLCSEPTITEMNRTLNLSSIMENIDTYSKGQKLVSDSWIVDDLQFKFEMYPKGTENGIETAISIYFEITGGKEKENKFRKVQVTMKYGDVTRGFIQPLENYDPGWGWVQAINHCRAVQHPNIHFNIKLYHCRIFMKLPSQSFEQKLANVNLLSQLHGDITLIVKVNDLDDYKLCDPPPLKKRKLNAKFQCQVCDKEFDSNKALKSHQSNKRDEPHKQFKNNPDNATEIKASSIILRASSKVFDRILGTNMREKAEKKIDVYAKNAKDVEDLLYFMNTNKLKIDSNALNIIELAHYYEMDELFWKCVNKMIKDISIHNFAETLKMFDKYEIKKGYCELVDFAKKNKDSLKKTNDFETIPHSFRCAVLNIDVD